MFELRKNGYQVAGLTNDFSQNILPFYLSGDIIDCWQPRTNFVLFICDLFNADTKISLFCVASTRLRFE